MKYSASHISVGKRWNFWLAWQVFRGRITSIQVSQDAYGTSIMLHGVR